ncbi:MAG: hypothetical protein QXR42_01900 [Candidatus Bathyarchaeia archaeon]
MENMRFSDCEGSDRCSLPECIMILHFPQSPSPPQTELRFMPIILAVSRIVEPMGISILLP